MLYLLLFKKKKNKKREKQPGGLSPGHTYPSDYAMPGFTWLLGTIKSYF
jgi:hypothetical protein